MPQPTGRSCTRSPSQGQLRKASDKRKKKGELSIADTIKLLRQRGMDVTADGAGLIERGQAAT